MAPIVDFTPAARVSPYADMINAELDALIEAGEGKATTFSVPSRDANKVRVEFAKAANAKDKTARVQSQKPDLDKEGNPKTDKEGKPTGNTTFVFTLTKRHASRHESRQTVDEVASE